MSDCIETALRHLADDDNLTRLEAELEGKAKAGPSQEWLLRMAELEDGCCTSVGGLAVTLGEKAVRNLEVVDDYLIDADTGEVLQHLGKPDFRIDSESAAEWVLEKRADAESRIVALKAKRDAVLANIDREIRHHEGRVKALDYRFGAELEQFARTRLTGKRRTWACAYGSVAFKRQAARWRWTPDGKAAALEYARRHHPGLVRVKTVEDVPFDGLESFLEGFGITAERLYDENEPEIVRDLARVVEFVPEGEKVTISTGVK